MFDKQKIIEMEERAKKEIQEEQKKTIEAYVKVFEEEIYKVFKMNIAENGKPSLDEYDCSISFNPRNDSGFETKRSNEHGMTNKELMLSVKKELEEKGYIVNINKNRIGEESDLEVILKIN